MIDINPVRDLLAKNNYLVTFEKLDDSKFLIKTPNREITPLFPAREITLSFHDNEVGWFESGELKHLTECNRFTIRVAIYYILSVITRSLKYSSGCITYKHSNQVHSNLLELMPSIEIEMLEKENSLTEIVCGYLEGQPLEDLEEEATKAGVFKEFQAIISTKHFFEKEDNNV